MFLQGTDTPFSSTNFNDLETSEGGSSGNPIVLDDEEDKENSSPTSPVSERPKKHPNLLRNHPFGTRIENVPKGIFRLCSQNFSMRVCVMLLTFIYNVSIKTQYLYL